MVYPHCWCHVLAAGNLMDNSSQVAFAKADMTPPEKVNIIKQLVKIPPKVSKKPIVAPIAVTPRAPVPKPVVNAQSFPQICLLLAIFQMEKMCLTKV